MFAGPEGAKQQARHDATQGQGACSPDGDAEGHVERGSVQYEPDHRPPVDQSLLSAADFVTDMTVRLPEGDLHFPTAHFSEKANILRAAETAIALAFGASALALDQALEVAGYEVRPDSDDPFDHLRSIVSQVRNAYAHGVAAPIWHAVRSKAQAFTLSVIGAPVVVDLGRLNGHPYAFEHIGGHKNWFRMRDEVVKRLETEQAG